MYVNKMRFEEIGYHSLISEKKYKMKWENYVYTGTFHQFTIQNPSVYADFMHVHHKNDILPVLYLRIIPDIQVKFFRPIYQKEKIQSAMERRAVNMILQRITNDPYFYW